MNQQASSKRPSHGMIELELLRSRISSGGIFKIVARNGFEQGEASRGETRGGCSARQLSPNERQRRPHAQGHPRRARVGIVADERHREVREARHNKSADFARSRSAAIVADNLHEAMLAVQVIAARFAAPRNEPISFNPCSD